MNIKARTVYEIKMVGDSKEEHCKIPKRDAWMYFNEGFMHIYNLYSIHIVFYMLLANIWFLGLQYLWNIQQKAEPNVLSICEISLAL